MRSSKSIAVVCSTGGSVLDRVAAYDPRFTAALSLVVTDRPCGAEAVASRLNARHVRIDARERQQFSDQLLEHLRAHEIDFTFFFFTRLLGGPVLTEFRGRLINFHLSLLPACPGLHGFRDTLKSGALFCGSTVHLIDAGADTGPIIQQSFVPVDPSIADETVVRHQVFLQQCASLSQVASWALDGRLQEGAGRRVMVAGARYDGAGGFVPGLESEISQWLAKGVTS